MTREEQKVYNLIQGTIFIAKSSKAYPIFESLLKKGFVQVFAVSPTGKFFQKI